MNHPDTVSINGKRVKTPSKPTIHKWLRNGYAQTPDGCKVELDGRCHHGLYSWMIYLWFI
jgi:hypothetical protein